MSKVAASTRAAPVKPVSDTFTKTKRRTLTSIPSVTDDKVQLKSIFGLTASSNTQLSCTSSGLVAYPSGCAVVLYDPKNNAQTGFLTHPAMKPVASLCFSPDSKYLAVGETGHNPSVVVWELSTQQIVARLKAHRHGIQCLAFSPTQPVLVSVGFNHDGCLFAWNWKTEQKLATGKVSQKISGISFSEDGSYFVTCGKSHLKFWSVDGLKASSQVIDGKAASLGFFRGNTFADVVCGKGPNRHLVYSVTAEGSLCCFQSGTRELLHCIELEVASAHSLAVFENALVCGCSDGIVRVLTSDFKHVVTLPKPTTPSLENQVHFPAATGLCLFDVSESEMKIATTYSDKSFIVWDIKGTRVARYRSFQYHSGCIWGVEAFPMSNKLDNYRVPKNSVATCSADGTIRFWSLVDLSKCADPQVLVVDPQDYAASKKSKVSNVGLSSIKMSPGGGLIASGDREGNLRVHSLTDFKQVFSLEAHDSDILSIDFSARFDEANKCAVPWMMATAGRDRFVHLFDVRTGFAHTQTLDDHSAAVISVNFSRDNSFLMTSSADRTIRFKEYRKEPNSFENIGSAVSRNAIYDAAVSQHSETLIAVGQEKKLNVYDFTGKQLSSHKADVESSGGDWMFTKACVDPWTGHFVLTATSDKKIRVFDTQSGDSFSFLTGHSEPITGLAFTNDCRHIVSTSGDGCLCVWEMSSDLIKIIFQRRVDQNGVESIELDSVLAVEHFLNKTSQQALPAWAKAKVTSNAAFQAAADEVEEREEAPLVKGRWAQRLNQTKSKENLRKKGNEPQKRRYTIEPEEDTGKRQRTAATDRDADEVHTFAADLTSSGAGSQVQAEPEKLVYVEGEKGELHTKAYQPAPATTETEEEAAGEELAPPAVTTPVKVDDHGFQSSVEFLEKLHKPLANEEIVRASARKTLTKGFLKRALSDPTHSPTGRVTGASATAFAPPAAQRKQAAEAKDQNNKAKLLEKQMATAKEVSQTRELLLKLGVKLPETKATAKQPNNEVETETESNHHSAPADNPPPSVAPAQQPQETAVVAPVHKEEEEQPLVPVTSDKPVSTMEVDDDTTPHEVSQGGKESPAVQQQQPPKPKATVSAYSSVSQEMLEKQKAYVLGRVAQLKILFDTSFDLMLQLRGEGAAEMEGLVREMEGTFAHFSERINTELFPRDREVVDHLQRIEQLVKGLYKEH